MALTIGARLGPYEVLAPIGAGGMGEVYRARDTSLQRNVALKVLPDLFASDPERLARFQREAQVLAALNHPHIAQVHGLERAGEVPVLVMEFVPGETLEDGLRASSSGLPPSEVLPIAGQIAEALEAAHEQGIVHRDLKPANVKLTPDGSVKVLDFGLAKLAQSPASGLQHAPGLTQSPTMASPAMVTGMGMLLGTAAYMAPEQARGKAVDKRADIWAFGCVLFELLSGKPAFEGDTVTDVLSAIVGREPEWSLLPASTPPHVRALIERCLVKDPRARLRDIGEARIVLCLPSTTSTSQKSAASKGASSRREGAAWALAALSLLGAVGAFVRSNQSPSDVPAGVVQLSVDLPLSVQILGSGDPRLSPDGGQLAFRATDGRGTAFWVHNLQSGGPPRKLFETTDSVGAATWSPDSKEVAFFSTQVLRAMELSSGSVRTIGTVPEGIANPSAWWGANDEVIFGGSLGGLYRIPSAGGTPTALTTLLDGQIGHSNPALLPDGKRFVYTVNRRTGISTRDDEVWLSSLDRPQVGHLLLSGARGSFVAPSSILALREGSLTAHRFDLNAESLSAEAAVLPITIPQFSGTYSYSAQANLLAFRFAGSDLKRRLAWYDKTGRFVGEIAAPDNAQGVEIAPDGSRVAFEVFEAGLASRDLWVAELATGTSQKVLFTSADEADAKWLPDSKTVLIGSRRDGSASILQFGLDSTAPPTAVSGLPSAGNQYPTSLSRDGRVLTFIRDNRLFWRLLAESEARPLPQSLAGGPARPKASPDGRWLIYESPEAGGRQVFLEPLPPTGARWSVSRDGGTWARWHPNGREIYFVSPDDAMMVVAFQSAPTVRLGPPTRLFQTRIATPTRSGVHANYDLAPDGRLLIVENTAPAEQSSSIRVIVNWRSLLPTVR